MRYVLYRLRGINLETTVEVVSEDRASKCLQRIRLLSKIREQVCFSVFFQQLPVEKSTKETLEKDVLIVNNKEPRRWHRSGDFIVILKHISHLFLVFLRLTLNK